MNVITPSQLARKRAAWRAASARYRITPKAKTDAAARMRRWRAKHPKKAQASTLRWMRKNREYYRAYQRHRYWKQRGKPTKWIGRRPNPKLMKAKRTMKTKNQLRRLVPGLDRIMRHLIDLDESKFAFHFEDLVKHGEVKQAHDALLDKFGSIGDDQLEKRDAFNTIFAAFNASLSGKPDRITRQFAIMEDEVRFALAA